MAAPFSYGQKKQVQYAPTMEINQVEDFYSKKNFQSLAAYHREQGQLDGFKFFEITIDDAKEDFKFQHNLGFVPRDVIVTRCTGSGTVTFNYEKFSEQSLSITTTGSVRIRCFVGTYSKDQTADTTKSDPQPMTYSTTPPATAVSTPTTTTTDSNAETAVNLAWSIFPVGMMLNWPGPAATIPTNWAERDGRSLPTADYPELFAILGYAHGGSGSNFNIPDTRGRWERHLDTTGSGRDPDVNSRTAQNVGGNTGAQVGSYQSDAFQNHQHPTDAFEGTDTNGWGRQVHNGFAFAANYGSQWTNNCGPASLLGYSTSSETRGKNVAFLGIIKLK